MSSTDIDASPRAPWLWLAGLSAYWFASSFKWFLLLVIILPAQVQTLMPGGAKSSYWGAVLAAGATWAVIGPALFGDFSDRLAKRRPFIALGAVTTVLALIFMANAGSIWVLAVAYLLVQVSDDIGTGPYSAVLPELVKSKLRGSASGLLGAAMGFGQIAAILTVLAVGGKGLAAYGVMILITVLGALLTLVSIGRETGSVPTMVTRTSWTAPFRNRDFFTVWLNRFLISLGFYLVVPYASYFLQDVVGSFTLAGWHVSNVESATAVLALVIALSGAVVGLFAGRAADRFGRKPVVYVSGILMTISLLLMVFVHDFTAMCLLALFFGSGYGAYQAASWALATDVLPDKASIGRDMGIWQMSISSVQILAGSAGFIVTYGNGVKAGLGYQLLFLSAAVAVGASTLLVRRVTAVS